MKLLLAGIPRSAGVALVSATPSGTEHHPARVLHWERRRADPGAGFRPSEQLILEAIRRGQSVSYVWGGPEDSSHPPEFTVTSGVDWAFCSPVVGEAAERWAIYVFGKFGGDVKAGPPSVNSPDLLADLKFTELVASILGALRQVRSLQRKQAVLSQFFSPVVIESLADDDPEIVLAPRETDVSVLFCDLRGFSLEIGAQRRRPPRVARTGEQGASRHDLSYHGFRRGGRRFSRGCGHGVLGLADRPGGLGPLGPAWRRWRSAPSSRPTPGAKGTRWPTSRWGSGSPAGSAVAGKIGTVDQAKVSVFGPVVNLASRLEGMTKFLHAPILMDEATARLARKSRSRPDLARFRRLARVKPYGLRPSHEVTELLPPLADWPN